MAYQRIWKKKKIKQLDWNEILSSEDVEAASKSVMLTINKVKMSLVELSHTLVRSRTMIEGHFNLYLIKLWMNSESQTQT